MNTLQFAHDRLTEYSFCPVYHVKSKVDQNGNMISSPYCVSIFCPLPCLDGFIKLLNHLIPEFKIVYMIHEETQELVIYPLNEEYQYIANQIYSSQRAEQLECVLRMIDDHFPGDEVLIHALAKKFEKIVK